MVALGILTGVTPPRARHPQVPLSAVALCQLILARQAPERHAREAQRRFERDLRDAQYLLRSAAAALGNIGPDAVSALPALQRALTLHRVT